MKELSPHERGFTLTEMVVTASIGMMTMAAVAAVSVPTIAREQLRSATYEMQAALQRTQIESVTRNRDVKFVLDPNDKTYRVLDTKGTADGGDDEVLHHGRLPDSVRLASPDSSAAVSLTTSSGRHEVTYGSSGTLKSDAGHIMLNSGGKYERLDVQLAGGIDAATWQESEGQAKGWSKKREATTSDESAPTAGADDDWTDDSNEYAWDTGYANGNDKSDGTGK